MLLERVIETGKPLLISTRMSEEREIGRTVEFLEQHDATFELLHCRSTYPAPFYNLNLAFIEELRERYGVPVLLRPRARHRSLRGSGYDGCLYRRTSHYALAGYGGAGPRGKSRTDRARKARA